MDQKKTLVDFYFFVTQCVPKYLIVLFSLLSFISCTKRAEKRTDPGISVEGRKILNKAESISYNHNPGKAMLYLDSAYRTFKNPSAKELFEKFKDKTQYHIQVSQDAARANLYADSMLASIKGYEKQYSADYADALFAKGNAVLLDNGYNKAFKYYYDAQQYALKNLDKCESFGFTYRLGLVRYNQQKYAAAIAYLKKAYAEGSKCNDDVTVSDMYLSRRNFLNTIGLAFEHLGQLDSAIFYYQKELQFIENYGKATQLYKKDFLLSVRGVAYGNLGGVYAKLGKLSEAERYLKESIFLNETRSAGQTDALTAKLKLAELYFGGKLYKKTGKLLDELQNALDTKRNGYKMLIETELNLYKLQWQYYNQTNNVQEAYHRVKLYYHLRDSLEKISHKLKVADVDLVFKNTEQQYKLNLLSKENEVKKGYLITFIIFSVMATITLFLLWRNRIKLKLLNTEIILRNADMQKILTALEQSQAENTRMMKIVAHDLRSPIAAAISIARMLKSADMPAEDREMLELLETSSLHSLEMISDLLNVNISAEGLIKEPVELHTLVRYCVNLLHFKADDKLQQLRFSPIAATVQINREKIWRVVSNLIVNAIKFSPVSAEIEITMYKTDGEVVVSILDHGIGIPDNLKEKIFDIFTDAKRKGTSGEHSFGLGLAVSKQIIEAHKGRIWLESEVHKGSTFFIALPLD